MLKMAAHGHKETGMKKLFLAGGVALNCVANGRLLREGPFDDIWIQPAAGDAGGALGIALAIWHRYLGKPRASAEKAGTWVGGTGVPPVNHAQDATTLPSYTDEMNGSYLGPQNSIAEIKAFLQSKNLPYKNFSREQLPEMVAQLLSQGRIIGLHQGRMEFGPRALGARSIIGDPRSTEMQSVMNLKIKYRESFRPFAPSVLREHVADWFDLDYDSPYMMLVADVVASRRREMSEEDKGLFGISKLNIKRSEIPAVTHVDYSARIQTVRRETNPI